MIVVKELKVEDLDKANDLYCECFLKDKKEIRLPLLGTIIGVYLEDKLIGIAQIDYINNLFENKKIGYVNSLCIKKEYRHLGYGTILLEECMKIIQLNGGVLVNLTSNRNRVYAHMLYKKMGFEVADTVLLKKEL